MSIYFIPKNDPQDITTSNFDSTTSIYEYTTSDLPKETTDQSNLATNPTTIETNPTSESTSSSSTTSSRTSSSTSTTTEAFLDLIVPRSEWTSNPIHADIPSFLSFSYPIRRIIVGQTDDATSCMNRTQCISKVQDIRSRYNNLLDIPWNFLIGDDEHVYEGRGYRFQGQHTMNVDGSDYNDIGIGIGFIGNFEMQKPSTAMLNAFNSFILESIENGDLIQSHKTFFQDQLMDKAVEAVELINSIKEMENFYECY